MDSGMCNGWRLGWVLAVAVATASGAYAEPWWKPYSAPCVERENVFAFTEKPSVKFLGNDKYEIAFAVKGACDVTVGIVDPSTGSGQAGKVVRHLASGVLGSNAPAPFQRNSLKQRIIWNGKDDLEVYVKEPGKLKARVMLGLKPVFHRRLGGVSPHNIPGPVIGIAVGPKGAVVFSKKWRLHARRFDLDGEYRMSLLMPPANLPEEKLAGMGYVEYEPGKRAVHGPNVYETVSDRGRLYWGIPGSTIADFQPALYGDRVYFLGFNAKAEGQPSPMYWLKLDGSTEFKGVRGAGFAFSTQRQPRLVASPDGKWLYVTGVEPFTHSVVRRSRTGDEPAEPFLGNIRKTGKGKISVVMGSDTGSFNKPAGIDCDAKGRIYVCDGINNRIQIFSPGGKHLKTVRIDRPRLIRVHQKTGAMYVLHTASVRGVSVTRLTKLKSFDAPREAFHRDNMGAGVMALDSWSPKPRIWLGQGDTGALRLSKGEIRATLSVAIYEDEGAGLRKLMDFDERARKDDGPYYGGRWGGSKTDKLVCDPLRERAYYRPWGGGDLMFDLKSGRFLGRWQGAPHRAHIDDVAFDKRGYMHTHFNPTFYLQGSGRVDATQPVACKLPEKDGHAEYYPEAPYDYGVLGESQGGRGKYWQGILPLKDQSGPHGFQLGIGVNMRGDVAVVSQIYYVPKMEDSVKSLFSVGYNDFVRATGFTRNGPPSYAAFMQDIQTKEKRGEAVYFIRRRPGIPLSGSTIWTFDRTGELRAACAVNLANYINGVEIDEDGDLYLVGNKIRLSDGAPFLSGRGGTFGGESDVSNRNPMTGVLMKTRGKGVNLLMPNAVVPMNPLPARPPDLIRSGYPSDNHEKSCRVWIEGAKWMYAGASPFIFRSCRCPQLRFRTDWYKRTFVPEAYRHSVGIVDTNGNLIMHVGQYGNFDSASGPKSKIPVGKDGIGLFQPRVVSATDNYIAITCWVEWVTVLKIEYHAEATAPISL